MIKNKTKNTPYYNIGQLRVDYWNKLRIETSELARCHEGSANEKAHQQKVRELIKDLKGVECFFASPGKERLRKFENAFSNKEYSSLSHIVAETTRELVGDSYKSNPDYLEIDESSIESVEEHEQFNNVRKNHFEVLFIDNISNQYERKLKQSLRALRTPTDKFTYDIVVQRSFQDAMIALLFNHHIQAVVVRYAPPYHSKIITPLIKPYIEEITKLDLASKSEIDLGPIIGELIKQFRPELDTYYVTDTFLGHLKDSTIKGFRRIFYQTEDIQELHLTIMRGIAERYETPFFSALVEYSQKPTGVFHAMPISRGNSVFKSRWINDFSD
ncbi:MAG: hypothetical protein OEM26_09715, partial [Saprospiraceae bacterium]|nr:hypothetical protein [Saprospiraceae bacterium]